MTLPPLVTFHFNALPLGRCLVFCRAASNPIDVFFRSGVSWSKLDSHLPRFQTLILMAYLFCCLVQAKRCHWEPSSGYCILAHDRNSPGPCAVCVLAKVRRLLFPDDVFDSLGLLDKGEQAQYCFMKYLVPACVKRATARTQADLCGPTSLDPFYSQRVCLYV